MIVETNKNSLVQKETEYEREKQRRIKKLNESNKFGNVFEGTQEIQQQSNGPLAGVSPQDKGVDISVIEKIANGKWKNLI